MKAWELRRAIELDPNSRDAHALYGYCLQAMGKADEAVVEMRRAREIDPVWNVPNNDVAFALYRARRYDEAITYAQESLRLNSDPRVALIMGDAYLEKGMPEAAIAAFQQSLTIQPNQSRARASLGTVHARLGKRGEALEAIKWLEDHDSKRTEIPFFVAGIYASLGERDKAFAWLDRAYDDHDPRMWSLKLDPRFDSLRSDERFLAFLRRTNLEK